MITGAAVVLVGAGAASAVAAGATSYGVYRQKKKQKQNKERHRQMISSMQDQWKKLNHNENVDSSVYPKVYSHIEEEKQFHIPLPNITSIGFGVGEDMNYSGDEIQLFISGFNSLGQEIETVTFENKRSSDLPGIRHTGIRKKPKDGRLFSGMPDNQNIILCLDKIKDNVDTLIIGGVISTTKPILDAYFALFKGKDVETPRTHPNNDPALVRYFLDEKECGNCNGYTMGAIQRDENGSWVFKPIRAATVCKSILDLVPKMQEYVLPAIEIPSDEYSLKFSSDLDNDKFDTVVLTYDRYGFKRSVKKQDFTDEFCFEDFLSCDSICKIVVVLINKNTANGDVRMTLQELEGDEKHEYTIPAHPVQVACALVARQARNNVAFPARVDNADWTFLPFSSPLRCDIDEITVECDIINSLVKEKFVPFTANKIAIELQAGTNLQFISSGTESPRKKKGFDRKNLKVEPIVNVLFNDLKFRSTVMKRNANPEWDQTFFFPLESDWHLQESIISFKVKDKASKGVIGECGYCIKTLDIPYNGSLFLDNKESKIYFSVNVIESNAEVKITETK